MRVSRKRTGRQDPPLTQEGSQVSPEEGKGQVVQMAQAGTAAPADPTLASQGIAVVISLEVFRATPRRAWLQSKLLCLHPQHTNTMAGMNLVTSIERIHCSNAVTKMAGHGWCQLRHTHMVGGIGVVCREWSGGSLHRCRCDARGCQRGR
eukprot:GGOE01011629.1.p2 GENE.GGOE01011629.1~~GGOE01011629.1.p2  ORF type:complete len:150 (+),score=3.99 GGOE01011629.1:1022-1471(+)